MFGFSTVDKDIELRSIPNLDKAMEELCNKGLFDLGYIVLYESLIAIRSLTYRKGDCEVWIKLISDSTHNIPIKLKESNTSFLKEELLNAITVLYNLANSKIGKHVSVNPYQIIRFFDEKGFDCTYQSK
ncbi:hypothetical protein COL77_30630 [Bacillus wiedmannii]|uniref:hypothetical protein n=1 Tax=Bacillus wiedmannii TaxID=1890302 RepID=UPI000BF7FE0A|nr:hypothetical protein [Bacillus wiedmannii]PFZ33876.1 hypothetical protein COL77_30630 [Bacillus wiedmannii]